MGTPQAQMAAAIASMLGRVGRFAVLVGVGGGVAQTALYTGDSPYLVRARGSPSCALCDTPPHQLWAVK